MSEETKLKNCPFCDDEPELVEIKGINNTDKIVLWKVRCNTCGAEQPSLSFKATVIWNWNNRET